MWCYNSKPCSLRRVTLGISQAALLLSTLLISTVKADLRISEFLASNGSGIKDEDGDRSDWIEIHNTDALAGVDLAGLALTDEETNPAKWLFPSPTLLAPSSYLVIFASGKNRVVSGQELHTNFKLKADGEYVGLYSAEGVVLDEHEALAQTTDRSFGYDNSYSTKGFFQDPTPGAPNPESVVFSKAQDVQASEPRGYYETPFFVALTSPTESAQIRYTTDGSKPTASTGIAYEGTALRLANTTVLRAAAFGADLLPSDVTTFSYIFLAQVIRQPKEIPNFPVGLQRFTQGANPDNRFTRNPVTLDMAMDASIVDDPAYSSEILDAMRSIPTMILAASPEDIWGTSELDGFYNGGGVEKEISLEVLYPNGDEEQINVGCEGHSKDYLKRSLRLNFRSDYGQEKWETNLLRDHAPLNGESATDTFRTLIVRGGHNRAWTRTHGEIDVAFTLDQFVRDTQIEMSGYGVRGTFVHLYLNHVYWGLYNVAERPDDHFAEAYWQGDEDDYLFTNHGNSGLESRDTTRWDYLIDSLIPMDMAVEANYLEMQQYVDTQAFADYALLMFYMANVDWPNNNWYMTLRTDGSPLGPSPALFHVWDAEQVLTKRGGARIGASLKKNFANDDETSVITKLWHSLRYSPAFRQTFIDRVNVHTSPGGALTDATAIERWNAINDFIRSAVIGESARWGDALKEVGGSKFRHTRTRDGEWQDFTDLIRDILTGNEDQLLQVLTDAKTYGEDVGPAPIWERCSFFGDPGMPVQFFNIFGRGLNVCLWEEFDDFTRGDVSLEKVGEFCSSWCNWFL